MTSDLNNGLFIDFLVKKCKQPQVLTINRPISVKLISYLRSSGADDDYLDRPESGYSVRKNTRICL